MSTGRDLISRVRSFNKLISADNNITDRAIFKELKSNASLLIKRETNLRKLWNSANIFTAIKCLELETVPLSECCDYASDCQVSRSKKRIPQIAEGIFGLLIQTVFTPGMSKLDYAEIDRFINILNLGIKNIKKYFWLYDGYIYVSNPDLESINIIAYYDVDFNPRDYSGCLDPKEDDSCINPLDKGFKIPSYLEQQLISLVDQRLQQTYFRHLVDPTTDAKDDEKS